MNKIAFCNFHEGLNEGDILFTGHNTKIGDDLLRPFYELRQYAAKKGIMVASVGTLFPADADAVVFIDMPDAKHPVFVEAKKLGKKLFLMVVESPLICPENYDPERLVPFEKVFTYNDSAVDGQKFFKLNYAFDLPREIDSAPFCRKLCVMIAGNKKQRHGEELYSERLRVIRWFEKNHPDDFDLYGFGWGKSAPGTLKFRHYLNPFRTFKILFKRPVASYKGTVSRKRPVLAQYKFSFCYENMRNIPGYITEKIFDSFFAGTVPIYLGSDTVKNHIPSACFIDKRDFKTYGDLYDHLKGMNDAAYGEHMTAIRNFLGGAASEPFSIRNFIRIMDEHLLR